MTKFRHTIFFLLVLISCQARADLILNGSFENPPVTNGAFSGFTNGSTSITDWTVVGSDVAVISGSFASSGIVFNAQDGNQWLDLAGGSSNSPTNGVMQNVATVAGQSYDLSFYVGSATDNAFFFASTVDLSINGGARLSFTNPTTPADHLDWKQFSYQFTASSAITNIQFFNGSAANNYASGLDNVSMTGISAVPEPSSGMLICLTTFAACWIRQRAVKRSAATFESSSQA